MNGNNIQGGTPKIIILNLNPINNTKNLVFKTLNRNCCQNVSSCKQCYLAKEIYPPRKVCDLG